jgi:hypothetical protein
VRRHSRRLRLFDGVGVLEFGVEFAAFLLLFLLLRELLEEAEVFFGGGFARCGVCLLGLIAVLISKELSTTTLYVSECRQLKGRVEGVWSECHFLRLPRF